MKITAVKTRVFRPNEDLLSFINEHIGRLGERSVLVITSKIVALAEGRWIANIDAEGKEEVIRAESEIVLATPYARMTIRDGQAMANAGVDESNADGALILLPRDSFRTASFVRRQLMKKHRLHELGVVITDSRTMPFRSGITGVALGYAGIKGLRDYRGEKDIFGRPFKFSRVDVADSLAAAAVLTMGEGRERRPLAIVTGAPVEYRERTNKRELLVDIKNDMYGPLLRLFKD